MFFYLANSAVNNGSFWLGHIKGGFQSTSSKPAKPVGGGSETSSEQVCLKQLWWW